MSLTHHLLWNLNRTVKTRTPGQNLAEQTQPLWNFESSVITRLQNIFNFH